MFEWFMELVLKTSDVARHRGFESLSLRHMEKYPRGRRGSPAKGVVWVNRSPGSNPGFSAKCPPHKDLRRVFFAFHVYRYTSFLLVQVPYFKRYCSTV